MKAVAIQGSSPAVHSTTYSQFKGVDFSTDPMLADKSRSPYAVNLISDSGGMPEKRLGWRTLLRGEGRVNGLWRCEIEEAPHLLAHIGTKIVEWKEDGTVTTLKEGVNDGRSTAFFLLGKLYILTGAEYLQFDGNAITDVEPYIPTVVVNRLPTGGGDFIESLNLIGDKWTEEFIGDGAAKEYKLSYEEVDSDVAVKIYNPSTSKWEDKVLGTDYTVNTASGRVIFTEAPAKATVPNVKITAGKDGRKKDKIRKGKSAVVYNDQVVFVAGAEKGVDYRSGYGKPNYFPDTGYDRVGTDETDIMGYCKVGEYLGIIKESNNQDSTIFLRWHEQQTNSEGVTETVYRKKQGVVGVGAISRQAIGMLLDEPLFLSRQGIFAITSNAVTFERTLHNRSAFVDYLLTREKGLDTAVCVEWNSYFLVCVNGHCYVLDSKQPTTKNRINSAFVYEAYYWENIPAVAFLSVGGELYFGTADGRICKFNSDIPGLTRFSDDGEAISAIWSTIADDDGQSQRYKTMLKKGCAVTLKPYAHSSVSICARTEKDVSEESIASGIIARTLTEAAIDMFDWEDIDFSRFTFFANDAPRDIMVKKKIKKYKRLQFIIKSEAVNEGFGIYQITKSYIVQGLAKR